MIDFRARSIECVPQSRIFINAFQFELMCGSSGQRYFPDLTNGPLQYVKIASIIDIQ